MPCIIFINGLLPYYLIQTENKFAFRLRIVLALQKNKSKTLYNLCPELFSFQGTCHHQMEEHIAFSVDWHDDKAGR